MSKIESGKTWMGGGAAGLDRRRFLSLLTGGVAAAGLGMPLASCGGDGKKVIVLGLDGLDPGIIQALIDTGRAPNFKKLQEMGSFRRLGTTMPALSPVAWSSFITGVTAGSHGISDFIVRDRETYLPVFSIYRTLPAETSLHFGDCALPIRGGGVENLRRGRPFWSYLTERGIPAVVIKIPTNFPVETTATRAIAGMGAPDLADAYGVFQYYTSNPFEDYPGVSGGYVLYWEVNNGRACGELIGPADSFCAPEDERRDPFVNHAKVPFEVYVNEEAETVRIDLQGQSVVLERGEFSEWVPVEFELLPVVGKVRGVCRFLLKEVTPHLRIYITPINIDPGAPAMPVTHPEEYGGEIADKIGPFWTKGLPCDTKALDYRIMCDEDYVKEAELILGERLQLFDYEWSRFREGLFYFYVSNTDQDAHMLWRNMDKTHPRHNDSDVRFAGYVHHLYEKMDQLLGRILPAVDDKTLLFICSDHGFAQFGRQFHLNTWLLDKGYLKLRDSAKNKEETTILDIDWAGTVAYGMGFNGLYLNRKGREKEGIVTEGPDRQLLAKLTSELEALKDLETGKNPVARVYRRDEVFSGELTHDLPELLVGYTPGYRSSSSSVLGNTGPEILDINPYAWSGDHSMARDWVPGVLFANKNGIKENPSILDLPVSILEFFGIAKPPQMVGESIFRA